MFGSAHGSFGIWRFAVPVDVERWWCVCCLKRRRSVGLLARFATLVLSEPASCSTGVVVAAVGCTCCVWTLQAVRRQFEMPAMYRSHEDGLSVMLSLGVRLPLKYGDVMFFTRRGRRRMA